MIATDKEVRVLAELPSVEKEDIKLHGTEDMLTIFVETSQRKYYKELELPETVDPQSAMTQYKNGVLEVRLKKAKKKKKPKGEPIKI